MTWMCGALWASACFTGGFLAGRPCVHDDECGPSLRCEEGVCGGPQGSTGGGTQSASTGSLPTTSGTATTEDPSRTSGEVETSTSTGTGTGTSTGDAEASDAGTQTSTGTDACEEASCGALDLLLIIDDSPSMAQWQPSLVEALQSLDAGPVGALIRGSCDAHIGVLTTGALYKANPVPCQGRGSLVRIGHVPCPGIAPYATQTDDLTAALACRVDVGSAGGTDERPVQALLQAMAPGYNEAGGCNDGFFRPDSLLVVLVVTDEDDDADLEDELPGAETPGTPQAWFDSVVAFKGSADRVVMLALTGDVELRTACPWVPGPDDQDGSGAESPTRLRGFIDMFPRRAVDTLCQRDYTEFIAETVHAQLHSGCEAQRATP